MRRYVIIGAGAAGVSAAETIRATDPSANLTMLTNDPSGYYSRPGLAYYLSGEVTQDNIFPYKPDYFRKLGLRIHGQNVKAVFPAEHRVELDKNQSIYYDRLLIATGAEATHLEMPGADLPEVVKLDSLADTNHILSMARRGRTAVVVGGGITALELVEGLRAHGMNTHYLLRGDRYWSNVLDETESRIIESRMEHEGIILHHQSQIKEILSHKGHLTGVKIKIGDNLQEMPCSILAVAIGIVPRKQLAEAAGIKVRRGVLVDAMMLTSAQDVFAAGDVAEVFDLITKEYKVDSLWNPAIEMGKVAGVNMMGGLKEYCKLLPFNVTRLAGLVTTIIGRVGGEGTKPGKDKDVTGINRGESETWSEVPDAMVAQTYNGDNRLRLLVSTNSISGALIMGDQKLSRPLQHLIQEQTPLDALRQRMVAPNAPLVELVSMLWQERTRDYASIFS